MEYFRNSMGPVGKCLSGSRIDERNVHDVVLVGGPTRIKFFATEAFHRVGGLDLDTHGNRFANELERKGLRDRRDEEEQTSTLSCYEQGDV